MTFNVEDGQGAQALDINLQLGRLLGQGVISGGLVEAIGGEYSIRVHKAVVYLNGSEYTVPETELDLEPYLDDDHPRKALVYVDTEGELRIAPGTAEKPRPQDQFRFDCFRPAPPDLSHMDAVVLAEVWVSPHDFRLTDADIRDRRLEAGLDVHSVSAETIQAAEFIDGAGVSHTDALADATELKTEAEIIDAINNDAQHGIDAPHEYFSGSHEDLNDVRTDNHHTRYTDTEARDAVRGSVDAASLVGSNAATGDHIEYTGSDVVWTAPPNQQAEAINSGTLTHTGGSSTTVLLAGITTDETAQFEMAVGVNADPSWSGDYAYSVDISRQWDDTNAQVDVEMTMTWDTDPGSGNDLDLAWTAFETSPVPVEGRFTDGDAITAVNGSPISPASVDLSEELKAPVYDDIATATGMEQGDIAVASGDGPTSFGQYVYDGTDWLGPLGTSVTALSELNIDTSRDWGGYTIQNLGAPSAASDAARQQELDDHTATSDAHHTKTLSGDIDHSLVSNVQSDQHHARYTDTEAVQAVAGRVLTSSLTGATIPSDEYLQNFHYIPDGMTMSLLRGEVVDETGSVPDAVRLQVYNHDTDTVVYQQSTKVQSGSMQSPLETVSGPAFVSVRIHNGTSAAISAGGAMNFELN